MIDGHTVTPTGYVKIDILLPDHIFHTNATILNSTVGRESERIEKWLRFVMKCFFPWTVSYFKTRSGPKVKTGSRKTKRISMFFP